MYSFLKPLQNKFASTLEDKQIGSFTTAISDIKSRNECVHRWGMENLIRENSEGLEHNALLWSVHLITISELPFWLKFHYYNKRSIVLR